MSDRGSYKIEVVIFGGDGVSDGGDDVGTPNLADYFVSGPKTKKQRRRPRRQRKRVPYAAGYG
jgi:hypothetical protein